MASSIISTRRSKGVTLWSSRNGLLPAGTNQTSSSRPVSRHCSATIRCPRWIGSNVPPKTPMRRGPEEALLMVFTSGAGSHRSHRRRGSQIHLDLTQVGRRLLRRHRVDVEAGTPLEAGHARQPWDDLDVPVVVRQWLRVKWGRVDDV